MSFTQTPSRYRFSRASRLLKPSEFQAVFDARKACRGQWLTVHRIEGPLASSTNDPIPELPELIVKSGSPARLGLIVAKRLVPAAVRRNLIRRVVREYFRLNPAAFAPGDWIVRLHESPFPSPARIRTGAPIPTRLSIVNGLRDDLSQILKRIERQRQKETTNRGG